MHHTGAFARFVTALWIASAPSLLAELTVVGTSPAARALTARSGTAIEIEFDRPVDRSSVSDETVWAFGRWSGTAVGSLAFDEGDRVVRLRPERAFSAGEQVMVILSNGLRAADGTALRPAGYSFQFWVRSKGDGFDFVELERFSTRTTASVTSRAYGGFGSDLDGDGHLDLTIVNEDTDDLRAFLNRGDGSGRFRPFLEPTTPVGRVPSPSEPSDFNRDGIVDVAVTNTQDETISILLGNGDGSFQPAQHVRVGGEPRGITVLDADGDGDVDVAATSFANGQTTIVYNEGDGRFDDFRAFGTGSGERAVVAGDMNGDGLLDLVVGTLTSEEIHVWLADGTGGFDLSGSYPSGGETWMLVLGDLDADGAEDVAVVNSDSNNAAILMGDGLGALGDPQLVTPDPFPLATDVADLDGDGDLDWVTSSFFGDWMMFENDGRGGFTLRTSVTAPQAASCSIPMDFNGDGALDLVLIDELEDEVVLLASRGRGFSSGFESGDSEDWSRSRGAVEVVEPGLSGTAFALEVSADGRRRGSYVESKHPVRETAWQVEFDLSAGALELAGSQVEIVRLIGGGRRAYLTLEEDGRRFLARLFVRESGGFREVGSIRVRRSGAVRVGIEWSSADGRAALSKDGKVRAEAVGLENAGQVISKVRLGLPDGSAGASGSVRVDEYVSHP